MKLYLLLLMAQESSGQPQGSLFWGFIVPLVVIFAIFYLLIIWPHSRQEKKRKKMLEALKKGDRVVTTGGIIGTITRVENNIVSLKIAPDVVIKIEKNAVRGVLSKETNSEQKK